MRQLNSAYHVEDSRFFHLFGIHNFLQDCLKIFGISKCNGIDAVMCELFSLEALRALHRISTSSTNWWFPAHLADLLQKADERITSAFGTDIRQHLVIEYGSSLFSEPGYDIISEKKFEN